MPGPAPSDRDIEVLREVALRREPFATARDIEPSLSVGYRQTRNRLNQLVERDLLKHTKVGTTSVYWLSDAGRAAISDGEF